MPTQVTSEVDERLAEALAFIERELRRVPALDEIARVAQVSAYHFHRVFRRQFGKTPKQLIDELRVAEVQRLALRGTTFTEAARLVGFSHPSHLGTRFKLVVGTTPRQWLRSVRPAR